MNIAELNKILNLKGQDLREALSRNEVNVLMQKGIKSMLLDAYRSSLQKTTFQEIVVVDDSEADVEDYPSLGQPELPREVKEGESFKGLQAGSPDNVKVTNLKYGGILEINLEATEDDQSAGKQIRKQAMDVGPGHAKFKDKTFWASITDNGTIYDGQNLFSLNHPGFTGGASRANNDNLLTAVTLSANAVVQILGITALWEGADPDQDMDLQVTDIMCPKRLEQTAFGITKANLLPFAIASGILGPGATVSSGMPSALKGKLDVISSHRLDKVSLTDWYWKTDFPGLLYLRRKGLQVIQEDPNSGKSFEEDKLRWKTRERFGKKIINWRGFGLVS